MGSKVSSGIAHEVAGGVPQRGIGERSARKLSRKPCASRGIVGLMTRARLEWVAEGRRQVSPVRATSFEMTRPVRCPHIDGIAWHRSPVDLSEEPGCRVGSPSRKLSAAPALLNSRPCGVWTLSVRTRGASAAGHILPLAASLTGFARSARVCRLFSTIAASSVHTPTGGIYSPLAHRRTCFSR